MSNSRSKESRNVAAGTKYVKMTSAMSRPPENEVRALAYQIFEANGRQEHRADQDWLQAEQQLLARTGSV